MTQAIGTNEKEDIEDIFRQALIHHQDGRLAEAEQGYRAVLQVLPTHPDANHNLGVLAMQVGQPAAGLPFLQCAVEAHPGQAQFWISLIEDLIRAGQIERATQVIAEARQHSEKEMAAELDRLAERITELSGTAENLSVEVRQAIRCREEGRYDAAIPILEPWLAAHPGDAFAHALLAQIHLLAGREAAAATAQTAAQAIAPGLPIVLRNQARLLLRQNRVDDAYLAARAACQAEPDHPENLLALAATCAAKGGKADVAHARQTLDELIRRPSASAEAHAQRAVLRVRDNDTDGALKDAETALQLKPHLGRQLWGMIGTLRYQRKDLDGAITALETALEHEPTNIRLLETLGEIQRQSGDSAGAITTLQRAVALAPDHAASWINLGTALQGARQVTEAKRAYDRALALAPENAEIASNLGVLALEEGNLALALQYFEQALEHQPARNAILINKAAVLSAQGRLGEAYATLKRPLAENEEEARKIFVVCCDRGLQWKSEMIAGLPRSPCLPDDREFRQDLIRALREPWGRPTQLIRAAGDHVKSSPVLRECILHAENGWLDPPSFQALFGTNGLAALASDELLNALLDAGPLHDAEMERVLTLARRVLLDLAHETGAEDQRIEDERLSFFSHIARQCFINEYVYSCTEQESGLAAALRERLVARLRRGERIPGIWLAATAAYFPLHTVASAEQLLKGVWPDPLQSLIVQQVGEPDEEIRLRATVPRLTPIDDEISLAVQHQYEENPYPRWVRVPFRRNPPVFLEAILRRLFPLATLSPLPKRNERLDVLIAGCGTGQQSIAAAQLYKDADVLAVDLSLPSLGYAKRKTVELGIDSIRYAQADLMKLGRIGRQFDVIECGGVLHHLADPWAGWEVLLSMLRPGGCMKIGLYSAIARRDIVRVRNFIAEQGYPANADGIRQCRQFLLNQKKNGGESFGNTLMLSDFYSLSACRDLLFHVQEHRLTLAGIATFLRQHQLAFLGFEGGEDVHRAYRQRFPDDPAATNLDAWQIFENEHPDIFIGMYQFWVQSGPSAQ